MANLIIGHTDHESVKIWVRGDRSHSQVTVAVWPVGQDDGCPEAVTKSEKLQSTTDYTGIVNFGGLKQDSEYQVSGEFGTGFPHRKTNSVCGKFKTFPASTESNPDFSFILGSCNISIIKVNNLLGLAMGIVGQRSADQSLKRQPRGRFKRLRVI